MKPQRRLTWPDQDTSRRELEHHRATTDGQYLSLPIAVQENPRREGALRVTQDERIRRLAAGAHHEFGGIASVTSRQLNGPGAAFLGCSVVRRLHVSKSQQRVCNGEFSVAFTRPLLEKCPQFFWVHSCLPIRLKQNRNRKLCHFQVTPLRCSPMVPVLRVRYGQEA